MITKNYILLIIAICIGLNSFAINDTINAVVTDTVKNIPDSLTKQVSLKLSVQKTDSIISVIGVGDIMLGTNFPSENYLPPNKDAYALLADVKEYLIDADLTVGNLEGCFSDTAPLVKRCKDSTKCYAFRMPEKYIHPLKDAGFDVLTIANNHSGDFGDLARYTTVKMLDSVNIAHAGWVKHPDTVFQFNGIKYGIAAFAPNKGTVSIHNISEAKKRIDTLNKYADIVIVTFHGGAEGSKHQHITKQNETFYGENRGNVHKFARDVIDAGADIVFGHGPHVSRAIDIYKNRFIAYSLGNFCTYGRFNLSGPNGIAPIVKVNVTRTGEFIDGEIISAEQLGRGGTYKDTDNRAVKIIKALTESDLPETEIRIKQNGYIYKAND